MKSTPKIFIFLTLLSLVALGLFYGKKPKKSDFSTYEKKALEALAEERFQAAINYYVDAIASQKKHEKVPELLLKVAELYQHSLGDLDQAHYAYRMVLDQYPRSFFAKKALLEDAKMMERHHRYQEALLSYQTLLDKYPKSFANNSEVLFKVAKMAIKLKKYQAAQKHLMTLLEEKSQDSEADLWLYHLGEVLFLQGEFRKSMETLELALTKYPDSPFVSKIQFSLANAAEAMGQNNKALELYQKLRPIYPNPLIIEQKIQNLLKEK